MKYGITINHTPSSEKGFITLPERFDDKLNAHLRLISLLSKMYPAKWFPGIIDGPATFWDHNLSEGEMYHATIEYLNQCADNRFPYQYKFRFSAGFCAGFCFKIENE